MNTAEKIHRFELAGLGEAPYTYAGNEQLVFKAGDTVKPGGSCDYCGTAIVDAYFFRSFDGRTFKVGSDCVNKAGDAGLKRIVNAEIRKRQKQRDVERIATMRARLDAGELDAVLENAPAPKGTTLWVTPREYAWIALNRWGVTGGLKACRWIDGLERAAKGGAA